MYNQKIATEEQLLGELLELGLKIERLRERAEYEWDGSIDVEIVMVENRIERLAQQHKAMYEVNGGSISGVKKSRR